MLTNAIGGSVSSQLGGGGGREGVKRACFGTVMELVDTAWSGIKVVTSYEKLKCIPRLIHKLHCLSLISFWKRYLRMPNNAVYVKGGVIRPDRTKANHDVSGPGSNSIQKSPTCEIDKDQLAKYRDRCFSPQFGRQICIKQCGYSLTCEYLPWPRRPTHL